MKLDALKNGISENRYSRDYLLCALCMLAFREKITLNDTRKEGENFYVKEDRKEDIYYWWFAGLKDILDLISQEIIQKYDYALDIDRYLAMLSNMHDFLDVAQAAKNDRLRVTGVSDEKDYYLFNKKRYEDCHNELVKSGKLASKIIEVRKEYLRVSKKSIWSAMMETYPAQRILGKAISDKRKDINADKFDTLLDKSVDYLKIDPTTVDENDNYGFLTRLSVILKNDKLRSKISASSTNKSNYGVLEIINSKLDASTFVDRGTGKVQTIDSLSSIDSELEEYNSTRGQVLESFSLPDLNKSLVKISNFNDSLSSMSGSHINMLNVLDSEPSCEELVNKLSEFTQRIYGKTPLRIVESPVFGTERRSSDISPVHGVVDGLYNSFKAIYNENLLYVSHLLNKFDNTIYSNDGLDFINYSQIYSSSACGFYNDIFETIRVEAMDDLGVTIPRSMYFNSPYYIYIFDKCSLNYDRASLPMMKTQSVSEVYLPVPYTKDRTHNTINRVRMVADAVDAFKDLKSYSEKTGKPLSDMYYYAKEKNINGEIIPKNIYEKTGGLFNMQNGDNEFSDVQSVFDSTSLLKKACGVGKFQDQSLILAEKMTDVTRIALDEMIDKITKLGQEEADDLSSAQDGQRRNMVVYINSSKIHQNDLISIIDIFCDRPNRESAFLQGLSWRTGSAFMDYDYSSLFAMNGKELAINNGFIRWEYYDGIFTRYNGDEVPKSAGVQLSPVYFMNFCNLKALQNATSDSSACSELARLTNFEYMFTKDFLGVEELMLRYVLPTLIDIKDGEVLKSIALGSSSKSKNYTLVYDKYTRIGLKLAWLSLNSNRSGNSGYNLDMFVNVIDWDELFSEYNDLFEDLGILGGQVITQYKLRLYELVLLKLKQLATLLAKSCMYTTDLVELCKVARDIVCAMLNISDKVVTGKLNKEIRSVVQKSSLLQHPKGPIVAAAEILFGSGEFYRNLVKSDIFNPMIQSTLSNIGREDLNEFVSNRNLDGLPESDVKTLTTICKKCFEDVYSSGVDYSTKEQFLKSLECRSGARCNPSKLKDYIIDNIVVEELARNVCNQFEEMSGNENDPYRSENSINEDVTDVSTNDDSDLSRFYACNYVVNMFNKIYSFICDLAHDCYRMSMVTASSNDADYQKLTLDRSCFLISYRRSMMEKLRYNYEKIKVEVSSPRDQYSANDLVELHKLLMLPESTSNIDVDAESVIKYFSYVVSKSRNGVNDLRAYIDKVFTSNERRVKRIAYPSFNSNSSSKFVLTSEILSEINQMATSSIGKVSQKSVNCIGKFSGSAIEILKSAVKDTGLYRSVTFKDGIAMTMNGEPLVLYSYNTNLSASEDSRRKDKIYAYVLHEEGLFFQINEGGTQIKPLDTVVHVIQKSGSNYLNSTTMSKDASYGYEGIFNSVSDEGIGIRDSALKAQRTRDVLINTLVDFSSQISEAKKLDLLDTNSDSTELIPVKGTTALREVDSSTEVAVVNNLKSKLVKTKEEFSKVFDVLTGGSPSIDVSKQDFVMDLISHGEPLTQGEASGLIDDLISTRVDVIQEASKLGLTTLSVEEAKAVVADNILQRNILDIGRALDVVVDTEKKVEDIAYLYSSTVPNTVKG